MLGTIWSFMVRSEFISGDSDAKRERGREREGEEDVWVGIR